MRKALVVAEVALSLVLLVGTGLMVRSFMRLRGVDPGFQPDHVLTLSVSLPVADGTYHRRRSRALRALLHRRSTRVCARCPASPPSAASTSCRFAATRTDISFEIEGFTPARRADKPDCETREVAGDWFAAMGIPIVNGPRFLPSDSDDAPRVVIVNQAWVRKYSPDRDPLGRRIRLGHRADKDPPWATIVGVIGDVHGYGLDAPPRTEMYLPLRSSAATRRR